MFKRTLLTAGLSLVALMATPAISRAGTESGYICTVRVESSYYLYFSVYSGYGCQGSYVGSFAYYSDVNGFTGPRPTAKVRHDLWLLMVGQVFANRWSKVVFETNPNVDGITAIGFTNSY